MKPIVIGSDDAGAALRRHIAEHLREAGHEVVDLGVDDAGSAYPSIAAEAAARIVKGDADRAILCCGTGLGMAIVANKFPGVYAATCHDTYSARRARMSNNAQVLTMGGRVIGGELALEVVDAWLESEFAGGRSAPKLAEIAAIEREHDHA
ncbi:MAG: RpiB/LacA/LacB family sugar-phosphate isomerase [Actinobacteria bacterium]|nr:RpiB/LacA/LacB family sugar-phosphate isomerase [Actinomycetota bacterium]